MGTSGGYGSFDVKQLWQMVDSARKDLPTSHVQIHAWNVAHQMLDEHGKQLQKYRDQLAGQWPPEQNPAAAAYLGHLDDLLLAATQTAQASDANARQLGFVVDAIEQAHRELAPLHEEYVKNETKLGNYHAQLNAIGDTVSSAPGPFGNPLTGAAVQFGAELFTSSPVADGRQDELNRRARETMAPLNGAAQDAIWNMQTPAVYEPPVLRYDRNATEFGGDSAGGATPPPRVAPPTHARYGSGAPDLPARLDGDGPVLSGTPIGTLPPSGTLAPGNGPPPGTGGPSPGIGLGVPPVLGGPGRNSSGSKVIGRPPTAISGGRASGIVGGDSGAGRSGMTLPPGGVIGGAGGAGARGAGRSASRVSPVGGVIGQGGAGGRAGLAGGQGPRGVRQSNCRTDEREGRWDPDNPWAVDQGVAPVLLPGEEPKSHDPGPGVIGIDR